MTTRLTTLASHIPQVDGDVLAEIFKYYDIYIYNIYIYVNTSRSEQKKTLEMHFLQ